MSNSENKTEIATVESRESFPADMSRSDIDSLSAYKQNGMPGLIRVKEEDIVKMRDMYVKGASYTSISKTFKVKKAIVLFLAQKEQWLKERQEIAEVNYKTIQEVLPYVQNDNIVFLIEASEFFKEYYRKKIQEYQRSGDDRIVQSTSLNALEKYLKCIKMIQDTVSDSEGGNKNPAVHVHVGDNSTVNVSDSSKPTPEQSSQLSEVLKTLAAIRKQREEG